MATRECAVLRPVLVVVVVVLVVVVLIKVLIQILLLLLLVMVVVLQLVLVVGEARWGATVDAGRDKERRTLNVTRTT